MGARDLCLEFLDLLGGDVRGEATSETSAEEASTRHVALVGALAPAAVLQEIGQNFLEQLRPLAGAATGVREDPPTRGVRSRWP